MISSYMALAQAHTHLSDPLQFAALLFVLPFQGRDRGTPTNEIGMIRVDVRELNGYQAFNVGLRGGHALAKHLHHGHHNLLVELREARQLLLG